jgi:hypothetical protein
MFFVGLLLDAARLGENIDEAKNRNALYISLFKGRRDEKALHRVDPYIFTMQPNTEFSNWFSSTGWGNSWGILFSTANFTLDKLFKHFQKFIVVQTEEGEKPFFRFYDPRVFRIFLPTCDTQQLKEFFGPIQQFICEDEDASFALIFSFDGKRLITERVDAKTVFGLTKEINIPNKV